MKENERIITYFLDKMKKKDLDTHTHLLHVHTVTKAILSTLPDELLQGVDQEKLLMAAFLHDIGKVEIPDEILNKDGELNADEWEIIMQHPLKGKCMVEGTSLREIGDWLLYHHERVDGRGYHGIMGKYIPLEARIIAVADTFSALRTNRAYRDAQSIDETMRIMRNAAGLQLDAQIIECFLRDEEFVKNIPCPDDPHRWRKHSARIRYDCA